MHTWFCFKQTNSFHWWCWWHIINDINKIGSWQADMFQYESAYCGVFQCTCNLLCNDVKSRCSFMITSIPVMLLQVRWRCVEHCSVQTTITLMKWRQSVSAEASLQWKRLCSYWSDNITFKIITISPCSVSSCLVQRRLHATLCKFNKFNSKQNSDLFDLGTSVFSDTYGTVNLCCWQYTATENEKLWLNQGTIKALYSQTATVWSQLHHHGYCY